MLCQPLAPNISRRRRMKHLLILMSSLLFAGCTQTDTAKQSAKPTDTCDAETMCPEHMHCDPIMKRCVTKVAAEPKVVDANLRTVADASLPRDAETPSVKPKSQKPVKKTGKTLSKQKASTQACKSKRRLIEGKYQSALNSTKSKLCKRDSDCLLLPRSTLCSSDRCMYDGGAINRRQAKRVKAIQYKADLKTCTTLTRSCEPQLHRERGKPCRTKKRKAYCENKRCVAKVPKAAPKLARLVSKPGAQLLLGTTRTNDRRYKMDITQSLMFARNAAFDSCLQYPGPKSGEVTFELKVTAKGTLNGLRQLRSTVPKRMGLCLKTWLKSLRYPAPKKGATTLTQVIRYVAP
jgi:hypothetical protein